MNKLPLILIAFFLVLSSLAALASEEYLPTLKKQLKETYSSLTTKPNPKKVREESAPIIVATPSPELSISLPDREIITEYDNHLIAGENNGIGLIESSEHFQKLINQEKLVRVTKGKGYLVDKLTHSHPYITPRSKVILEEIALAFQARAGKEDFFTITSVTRTPEQQKSLRKRNRNATSGISSHSYGISFDISYIRFNGEKGGNRSAQKDLEAVLNEFQADNKLFFIKERRQSCYHVTVR
jgi:hypothetical protein